MYKQINHIVSVGSVDGVCTSAALLRLIGRGNIGLQFTQAFTVDKVDPTKWGVGSQVLFVDLAVNNRDKVMTVDFLRRVKAAGHTIIGVLDEHNAEDWRKAFTAAELSFDDLAIKPVSQNDGDIKSSGALLLSLLGNEADEQTRELCEAADAGDRMDFSTRFGGVVNQAVKSDMSNDARRLYLARHFATSTEPDATILGWMSEYEEILRNHEEILNAAVDLGNGFVRVTTTGMKVDVTTLMAQLYKRGRIVVVQGVAYVPAEQRAFELISLGTADKLLDLLTIVKQAGIMALGGFAQKANVSLEDEQAAIEAVRAALAG